MSLALLFLSTHKKAIIMVKKLDVGCKGTLPVNFECKVAKLKDGTEISYIELSVYCELLDENLKLTLKDNDKINKSVLETICKQYAQ